MVCKGLNNNISGFLLLASGTAALIYQTLWVKQLGLIVGVDVYAVTTAVSAFFGGLAIGGYLFGRIADRSGHPYRLIFLLETGIAILAFLCTLGLTYSPFLFAILLDKAGIIAWLIPLLIIGIPAIGMGGTLPVLIRSVVPKNDRIGKASGLLYAANTAGAIIGALLVPFLLIPNLGLMGTALAGGSLNLLVASVALIANQMFRKKETTNVLRVKFSRDARLAIAIYTIAGALAIGYEVVWSQVIAPMLSSRIYAFAILLVTYLSGLVIGSAVYARFADRNKRPWLAFGSLIFTAGASALLIFAGLGNWIMDIQDTVGKSIFSILPSNMIANIGRFVFTAGTVLFIPTLFLGAAFPAVSRIVAEEDHVGQDIGAVTAFNTAGGIVGAMITGFVLIPWLGIAHSLGLLAILSAIAGGIAVLYSKLSWRSITFAVASALIIGIISFQLPNDKLAQILKAKKGGEIVFYKEGRGGTVAVLDQQGPEGNFNRLYIQGISNSGNSLASLRYMRLQGLLPLIIHKGEPKSALVIGFGTGITLGSLLPYTGLEKRVCAELLPPVIEAAEYFPGNLDVQHSPDVEIRIRDGRHELLRNPDKYDVITLEPPPPSAAGVVNLYSTEFYELARNRLNPNGIVAQWWPLATQNNEDSKSLVRSFLDVFPHVSLWTTEMHETLLVGSIDPLELDTEKIRSRYEDENVSAALQEVGVLSAAELLANYITDRRGLEKYAGTAAPVTDNRPWIEYAGWTRKGEFPRVLEEVAGIARPPLLIGDDSLFNREVGIARQKLWTLYRAGYYSYMGNNEQWEAMLKRIIPELKSNPYYKWHVAEILKEY